jgi:hypothetical protein
VVGLAWPKDSGSCAGGSVAIGRAFNGRQVKGDDTDEKRYGVHPGELMFGLKHKQIRIMFY